MSRFSFRVWDNINKRYEKDLTMIDKDGDICYQDGGKYCNGEHQEDFTIEQCTGLRDKNGTLIFEGDFVKITFRDQTLHYCVKYDQSNCQLYLSCGETEFSESFDVLDNWAIEVTGNVHDMEVKDE